MTPLIGKNIGGFRVLAKTQLGESGFVYKALHMEKRQTFALKLLRSEMSAESPLHRRFLADLQTAEILDHPHIGRTYPIEVAEGLSIIPLEFVYGRNLSETIAEGVSTSDLALRVALQVAEALQFAHAETAIHGCVTSNNLVLCSDDSIKLVEFALSRIPEDAVFSEPDSATSLAVLSGQKRPPLSRFAYQAPEQIHGEAASVRSDLFSLGVVLYELLAGEFLFEGTDREELYRQIESRELPKISDVHPGIGTSWTKILRALLEKKPADRYPSAQALLEDLRKLNYGLKMDRLSFQTAQPPLSRRSFFRRFLGEVEE